MINIPKCPYCNIEIHLEDFFDGNTKNKNFKGQRFHVGRVFNNVRMWVCPSCDKILGFSESAHDK